MEFGKSAQLRSLLQDRDLVAEIQEKAARGLLNKGSRLGMSGEELASRMEDASHAPLETTEGMAPAPALQPGFGGTTEAIVVLTGRPSLLIQNGTFEMPDSAVWQADLTVAKSAIEAVIARTGRVEVFNHFNFDWVGTGWLIAEDVIVTNRHVAEEFAQAEGQGFGFRSNLIGTEMGAAVDFREEFNSLSELSVKVEEILFIADRHAPDIAFLKITGDTPLPEPLQLAAEAPEVRTTIGTVGYPAFDPRNGVDAMADIFGDVFDKKRFGPGKVSHIGEGVHWFVHDAATLGGSSGSPVFDLNTGRVVGLHFSGRFLEGNFAVKSSFVADALAGLSTQISVPSGLPPEAIADGHHPPAHFEGREGYKENFLGPDVPLPGFGDWEISDPGSPRKTLDYQHFSVAMSAERKLALLTAVNIDGDKARRSFGNDDWFIDDRIAEEAQLGNEIYFNNDLDRGHMVRRLDPVWGTKAEADRANDDTYHYVNAAPQHRDLNQRVWLRLEDYLLDNAKARDLKMSVFTGPVFGDNDRLYRGLVRLPKEFYKVAVLVHEDTGDLISAGYILSQGEMIRDVTESAFVFGEHQTFQVEIERISQATGLDFSDIAAHDVMKAVDTEARRPRARRIDGPEDLIMA